MKKNGLVWFRNDLRVHDQPALWKASIETEALICVYCFDPNYWKIDDFGHLKTGSYRTQFLIESVAALRESLRQKGGELVIRMGSPSTVIPALCDQYNIDAVFFTKEHTQEETDTEEAVRTHLPSSIGWEPFEGLSMFHPEDLPQRVDQLPDVYTAVRKRLEKYVEVRKEIPEVEQLKTLPVEDVGQLPTCELLKVKAPEFDERAVLPFKGGEKEALLRLDHYFWESQELSKYKFKRNGLLGADYSSKFSPWLANGSLSPRRVYWKIQEYEARINKNVSTYWLFFELMWRDFFRFHAQKYGNAIFQSGGIRNELPQMQADPQKIEAWKAGTTGIPFIDANMIELRTTGFMSNRGRQNVASFLVKDLQQDWRIGASWFESQLIDYDVCSNWCNWNYVSGVGTDPRKERYFNVISQANRYDEKGAYVKHWIPELEHLDKEQVHQPYLMQHADHLPERFQSPLYLSPRWKS